MSIRDILNLLRIGIEFIKIHPLLFLSLFTLYGYEIRIIKFNNFILHIRRT